VIGEKRPGITGAPDLLDALDASHIEAN